MAVASVAPSAAMWIATKSTQEQVVASWINYLNQIRIDRLMEALPQEHDNPGKAKSFIPWL